MRVTIKDMRVAGLDSDSILDILEQAENEGRLERREQNRINQQNHRARQHVSNYIDDTKTHLLSKKEDKKESKKESKKERYIGQTAAARASHSLTSLDFERIWRAYPKRVAKKTAERAFIKALKETSAETIAQALARQAPSWTDPKFIPHLATWLNAGRWADEAGGPPARVSTPEEIEAGREWYRRKQAAQ